MPARELNSVRKLGTPSVSQETKAALCASTLRGCTLTSTTAASASTTATAASTTSATDATTSTAATDAPTPGTTPTSTATPSASSTASAAAPATPSTTRVPLALAVAASPTRAHVSGQGHERYFLLVVDDYSRYTTVFPLRRKGEVTEVLIDWIRGARRKLSETFSSDLPVLRLHSDRGWEFSSDLLRAFCCAEGIRHTFTLPASPQQNGIAEHRIGMVMDVAHTSMIHAAAPHFLWQFPVQYAAHQINLQPRVSFPETTPTLRWTGKVGDASVFRFYHPTSRRVLSSQDVTFDESISYYRLFPYRTAPLPPLPLFLAPGAPPVDSLPPQGPAPLGVSQVDPVEPVEVAIDSGAARGAEPAGAGPRGDEPGVGEPEGAEPGGAEPERVEPGGADRGGAESGGAEPRGAEPERTESGGPPSAPPSPLRGPSPYSRPTRGLTERREPESRPASPESRPASPESHPASPVCIGRRVPRQHPPPVPGTHSMNLRRSTAPQRVPLPSPPASSLLDGPDPESDSLCAASPTLTRFLATAVTDPSFESTAASALVAELVEFAAACRLDYAASLVTTSESASVYPPSFRGKCALGTDVLEDRQEEFECFAIVLPHLVSMLLAREGDPDAPDIPTPRSYAEAIEGPYSSQWQTAMDTEMASWKSTTTYVDEVPPPGASIVPDFFQTFSPTPKMTSLRVLLHVAAQRDYELHSLDFSTTFLQGSLHKEIWLRRPPGFTGSFPAGTQWSLRRPVYGLRQAPREWHDTLRTTLAALGFAPSTADPSLFLRTDTTLLPFYILVYVDDLVFATADTEALSHVKSELQKRHTCTDLGELTSYLGLRITRDRAQRTITLTQSHMVQQVLQRFGFMYSSPQSTPLPTNHLLSAPPSDESIEPSGPYPELVGCLMYLLTVTRPDLAYPLSILVL
ncbi:unnamed protein product [Closterium sp. NIES-54]